MANKEANLLLRIKTAGQEALSKITFTFGDMINLAKSLGDALATPIKEFHETELATNALTKAMVNNGIYSKELKDSYIEQANALSKVSLYEGDQILTAQTALQQQIGSIKVTKELTQSILDFATAQKMDVASAAEVVGKSIGTSNNALGRYGIEVNSAASESEKMSQVIQGLNNKFGGQAQAATEGLGALEMVKKSFLDLAEGIGGRVAPALTQVSQEVLKFIDSSEQLPLLLDAVGAAFKGSITLAYYLVEAFDAIGTAIGQTLGNIIVASTQLMEGEFKKAYSTVKDGAAETFDEIGNKHQAYQERVNALWKEAESKEAEHHATEEQMLNETLKRKSELQQQKAIEDGLKKQEIDAQNREYYTALMDAQHEEDMAILVQREDEKALAIQSAQIKILEAAIKHQNDIITNATTQEGKLKALKDKARMEESLADMKNKEGQLEREVAQNKLIEQNRASTLATISNLQNSSNRELAFIGKAAALTQIAIDTPVAIGRALAAFPPPFNYGAAAAVGVSMAEQAAKVAGIPLADGGVVMPRSGGTQAIIGEAGSAEAVIPLDKYPGLLEGGKSINITVYGGLLGDQSSAYEFAKAIDRELLKLRQNNESSAFDTGVV